MALRIGDGVGWQGGGPKTASAVGEKDPRKFCENSMVWVYGFWAFQSKQGHSMAWLWTFVAATFAVLAAGAGSSAPRGEGIADAIPFLTGVLVFGIFALSAHKRREEKSKQSWAKEYAQNLYVGFVASPDPGDITALKLKIPTALHAVYQNKVVLQRELISFVALASVANEESGLRPVLREYENLLVKKMAERGLQMRGEQMAEAAFDDARALSDQPFKWGSRMACRVWGQRKGQLLFVWPASAGAI